MDGVDLETGEIVVKGKDSKGMKHRPRNRIKRKVKNKNGVPTAVFESFVVQIKPTPTLKAIIVERYATGMSLEKAATDETLGLPGYNQVRRWLYHDYPAQKHVAEKFREEVKQARIAGKVIRAEEAHDKVLALADDCDEGNAQSYKVKIDALKWSAKVNDQDNYGDRTKLVGDPNAPVAFIIETGIRRDPLSGEEGAIPVESGTSTDDRLTKTEVVPHRSGK